MNEALAHIDGWNGSQVFLQVESSNHAAIALYDSMAFEQRGEVRRWQASLSRLRYPTPEEAAGPRARPLWNREWRAARELDRIAFAPDLNWPAPPPADYYKSGLLRSFSDLLNGRRQETWVIQNRNAPSLELTGLVDIVSQWGRPYQMRLCINSDWQEKLIGTLLHTAVDRLRRFRNGTVWFDHPASSADTDVLFQTSNFEQRRSLTVMRKTLYRARQTVE